ncbi:RNA polymerase sigma factor [Cohnella caldifontis]|uniref:RNA polymerase sigma factor n=1 Tax=Cohnella caldifontis TaxID=3027471 RepID=UPI0023EB9FBC|nr:DUF6596 domain-containing protein [Cohnella sp. YIM B05605]
METIDAYSEVERTARESYGRLVAYLAARWRDLAAAEDAMGDALLAALETWPRQGIPAKPESWLLTAASRRLVDRARHTRIAAGAVPDLVALSQEARHWSSKGKSFPDERLNMLFLCAHPEIDPASRTPLMLQTVLGVNAERIASVFLVKPAAMGQRLSRAKAKIREQRLSFDLPDETELPVRLSSVLEAIYAAYGSGWEETAGADARRRGLAEEAIFLCRLIVAAMPGEPEAAGLLSLMLHGEARRPARRNERGEYVPILEQNTALWSRTMMEEAERCLRQAARTGRLGRFQLEAAIQSVHAQRAVTGRTEWEEIALLYEGLARFAPTVGVRVGQAAAVAEARGAEQGWALLGALPREAVRGYQPYWATAGHLLKRLGRLQEAREAYSLAIGLAADPSVREFLKRQSASE